MYFLQSCNGAFYSSFSFKAGRGEGADSSNFDTDMHIAHAFPELEDGVMQDNVAVGRTS